MKRIFVLVLALCLVVPAISYAGSATSRWDLTIGGTVKTTIGYSFNKAAGDQSAGGIPTRDDRAGTSTINNKYGNWIWSGGESGLTFFVRGPDAWGAKTSAFMSTDFTGIWGGSTWGTLDLVVSTITFDWPNTTLQFGMAGGGWGMFPTFAGIGWSTFSGGFKGPAPVNPQVAITQRLTKEFSVKFGAADQSDTHSSINSLVGGAPTSYTRGPFPLLYTVLTYSTASCGKIGPWQMTFKSGAAYTREKRTFTVFNHATSEEEPVWYVDFAAMMPIIPQKNDGNKGGALLVDAAIYTGQNFDGYYGGWGNQAGVTSFTRPYTLPANTRDITLTTHVSTGGVAHVAYYFTDQFAFNGYYMHAKQNQSLQFMRAFPNAVGNYTQYIAQFQYEVNPAIKMQLMWDHGIAKYNGPSAGAKRSGQADTAKFSVFYYF